MNIFKLSLGIALGTATLGSAVTIGFANSVESSNIKQVEAASTFTKGSSLFLKPNSNWTGSGAWFAAYFYGGSNAVTWVAMSTTDFSNDYYICSVPNSDYTNVIFVRMSSGSKISDKWDGKWNQTGDLSAGNGDTFTVPSGAWDGSGDSGNWKSFSTVQSWRTRVSGTTGDWGSATDVNFTYKNDADGAQFYNTEMNLVATQELKTIRKIGSTDTWYGSNKFEDDSTTAKNSAVAKGYLTLSSGDGNITVSKTAKLEFYVKIATSTIWTQISSVAEATSWSNSFLSATTPICTKGGTSANHLTALQGIWEDQKNSFEALTAGAKNLIKEGSTADSSILDAHDRYVHIMGRYGDSLDAFESGPTFSQRINPFSSGNNGFATIVAIIASFGVFSFIGISFLWRKKKHSK